MTCAPVAELIEEAAEHLEAQYADLAPRVGAARAREQLLAQLRDQQFDDAIARRRRLAKPVASRTWTSTSVMRDVRYGVRSLRRSPGTVVAGVVALALGIGLTTVMYSIVYGILMIGLPFDEPMWGWKSSAVCSSFSAWWRSSSPRSDCTR